MAITILYMVSVPHKMVRSERMSDYRGAKLQMFHCGNDNNTVGWVLIATLK